MKNGTKKLAIGTAIAAATGYIAGLLTAPKSGKETRKDIHKAAIKAKTEAERNLKRLHGELNILIDKAKKDATKLKTGAKAEYDDVVAKAQLAKEKVRELLSALHDGDAEDKDLQHAISEANKALKHLKTYLAKDAPTQKTQ